MASTLQSILKINLAPVLTTAFGSIPMQFGQGFNWPTGTGLSKADIIWPAIITIASSGSPSTVDLNGGGLVMPDGTAANFVKIAMMYFLHQGTPGTDDANIVTISPHSSNGFNTWISGTTPGIPLSPGGEFLLSNPTAAAYGVTGGSVDTLKFATAAGTNVPILACLIGRSA